MERKIRKSNLLLALILASVLALAVCGNSNHVAETSTAAGEAEIDVMRGRKIQ